MLEGNILITGGAGYLGRGIMRRAKREGWPARFYVLSRDEHNQQLARAMFPSATYILGDVTDVPRMTLCMLGMDVVIHAAALKFIPEGEFNADECVRVNIDGARCVIEAARRAGVRRVVGISTDKAAQPVNVYGMTKAVMERLFMEAADRTDTTFVTCRYGNVIGSTGSVVPMMRRQLEREGIVRITDPHMTRFWMAVDDAVDTIEAALNAPAGSITVPSPRAASMHSLAFAVLGSMGQPMYAAESDDGADPRIHVVGRRPGEKKHEDLISHYELYRARRDGNWYHIMPPGNEDYAHEFPTLSSDQAATIGREELCEWIVDSVTV